MAQIAHPGQFIGATPLRPAGSRTASNPVTGVLHRIYDAVMLSNERQAERDMARFVSTRGKFTDAVERDISERAMRSDWAHRD